MSQRTLYRCDVCGKESDNLDTMRVETRCNFPPASWSTATEKCKSTFENFDTCYACAMKLKIVDMVNAVPAAIPDPDADINVATITDTGI